MTAAMMKTPYFLFDQVNGRWTSVENSHAADLWRNRHKLQESSNMTSIQPAKKESLYIEWIDQSHFEPAHNGLQRNRNRKAVFDA